MQSGTDTQFDFPDLDLSRAILEFNRRLKLLQRSGSFGPVARYRTPLRNARVGGNAQSQHGGTAADFAYVTPQQAPAFVEAARRAGLRVVDETVRTRGTGPHYHVQLFAPGVGPRAYRNPFAFGGLLSEAP